MTEAQATHFYKSRTWRKKRAEVLSLDKHECQHCRQRGRYRAASMVHHVLELKHRPDLALDIWHGDKRQLLSLCDPCHEQVHNNRHEPRAPLTPERW